MQNKVILLICIFCMTCTSIFSQSSLNPCGTIDHKSDWLKHYQRFSDTYDTRGGEVIYVPLTVFVVSSDSGNGAITPESLVGSLCTLNEDFADANIHFYLQGGIKYLEESSLYNHNSTTDAAFQMFDLNVPNTINCYIVGTAAGNCGYNLPYAGVVLDINCTGPNDHTWAHEIGHNLSLPHPFLGWEGGHSYDGPSVGTAASDVSFNDPAPETVLYDYTLFKDTLILDTLIIDTAFVEKVDGSNCEFAADGFCDTAPDYLAYRWNCTNSGTSIGFQTDPNGEQFKSDASLIMSYADDACSYRFTDEQIAAMRANLADEKSDYIINQTPDPTIENPEVTYNFPVDGEARPFDYVELEWEPVPNATHYWVKITIDPGLGFVIWEDIVTEPQAVAILESNESDRDGYWSVAPFTNYDFCVDFQGSSAFYISDVSSSEDITAESPWKIIPNVVSAGSTVSIDSEVQFGSANVIIRDMSGQLVYNDKLNSNQILISPEWMAGIYLVQISYDNQVYTQKLVVR